MHPRAHVCEVVLVTRRSVIYVTANIRCHFVMVVVVVVVGDAFKQVLTSIIDHQTCCHLVDSTAASRLSPRLCNAIDDDASTS